MRRSRTWLIALAVAATLGVPMTASAKDPKVQTDSLAALKAGQTAWVTVVYKGIDEARSVSVTVDVPRGYSVEYPSGRASTSFSENDTLSADEIDFVAFKLTVDPTAKGGSSDRITLVMTYVDERDKDKKTRDGLKLPIAEHSGNDIDQVTTSLGKVSSPGWVGISFVGAAGRSDDVRLTVTDPDGASIIYPANGSSSGPVADGSLEAGETDVINIRLDPTGVAKGAKTLRFRLTWNSGGEAKSLDGRVSYEVA